VNADAEAARELSSEASGGFKFAYRDVASSLPLTVGDNLMSAVYAKNASDTGYDGKYASAMDGGFHATWSPKWLVFWGMGRTQSWLSAH